MKAIKNIFNLNNFSLPLLLWLALYAWRPWVLGFYYDDWGYLVEGSQVGSPFSLDRLDWFVLYKAIDRPMAGLNHWFFTSLLGHDPFLWQCLMSLIFLLFMVVFYRFLQALFRILNLPERHPAIALGTALWPCLPWVFGWAAWTCTTGFIYMILFTWCGERLLSAWKRGQSPGLWPALIFGVLCFYYEQFYGQFIFFFAFGWLSGTIRSFRDRKVWMPLGGLLFVQMLAFAWNRLHSSRGLQTAFFELFMASLLNLPSRLMKSAGSLKGLMLVMALLTMGFLGYAVWRWLRQNPKFSDESNERIRTLLAALLMCVAGGLMCAAFYAAGGYQIFTLGTTSRTAVGLSFWLVVFMSLAFCLMLDFNGGRRWALVQGGVIFLLMVSLGVANVQRTLEWAHAWRLSNQVLDSPPLSALRQVGRQAVILYEGPFRYKEVSFFGSPFSLSAAMNSRYPSLRRPETLQRVRSKPDAENLFLGSGWTVFLLCSRAAVRWDGKNVFQEFETLSRQMPATQVWLWKVKERRLEKLAPPLTMRCNYVSGDNFKF